MNLEIVSGSKPFFKFFEKTVFSNKNPIFFKRRSVYGIVVLYLFSRAHASRFSSKLRGTLCFEIGPRYISEKQGLGAVF
jgi:hypothetical protein